MHPVHPPVVPSFPMFPSTCPASVGVAALCTRCSASTVLSLRWIAVLCTRCSASTASFPLWTHLRTPTIVARWIHPLPLLHCNIGQNFRILVLSYFDPRKEGLNKWIFLMFRYAGDFQSSNINMAKFDWYRKPNSEYGILTAWSSTYLKKIWLHKRCLENFLGRWFQVITHSRMKW